MNGLSKSSKLFASGVFVCVLGGNNRFIALTNNHTVKRSTMAPSGKVGLEANGTSSLHTKIAFLLGGGAVS